MKIRLLIGDRVGTEAVSTVEIVVMATAAATSKSRFVQMLRVRVEVIRIDAFAPLTSGQLIIQIGTRLIWNTYTALTSTAQLINELFLVFELIQILS